MQSKLIISLFGICLFSLLMFFGYKYANGNWKVSENKKVEYENWSKMHGIRVKKSIVIISIIYGLIMLVQIYNQIQ